MKIPNILTIGRILIAPILVIVFYFPGELSDWLSCAIFVIAAFTDYLDGFFARLYKQQSKFGELLDPIADKVLVATALALLIMSQTIKGPHVVAAIIIITREILISGHRSNPPSLFHLSNYFLHILLHLRECLSIVVNVIFNTIP
jgi:cardiolipin synthase